MCLFWHRIRHFDDEIKKYPKRLFLKIANWCLINKDGEKTTSSNSGAGKIGCPHAKEWNWTHYKLHNIDLIKVYYIYVYIWSSKAMKTFKNIIYRE